MKLKILCLIACAFVIAGCAGQKTDYGSLAANMMSSSFRDEGIAKTDRLLQDESNVACSNAQGAPLPEAVSSALQESALKTVRMPSDGKLIGDWRVGEKLAQDGKGMTWADKSTATSSNGGNCYNCHQITKEEVSFGTIGPSLYRYGAIRGVAEPESESAKPIVEYTWRKIYNAKAYNPCSEMPRFGHKGLLDEMIKHLMALLLDPKSPVNQ
jgi:sulfur-oxidizing protein SoxX